MVVVEHTVTFKVKADTIFRAKDKIVFIDKIAALSKEDQRRIEIIVTNPKALRALADNWDFLSSMIL